MMAGMTGNAGPGGKTPNPPGFNVYLTSYVSLAKSLDVSEPWLFIHKMESMPPLDLFPQATVQLSSTHKTELPLYLALEKGSKWQPPPLLICKVLVMSSVLVISNYSEEVDL